MLLYVGCFCTLEGCETTPTARCSFPRHLECGLHLVVPVFHGPNQQVKVTGHGNQLFQDSCFLAIRRYKKLVGALPWYLCCLRSLKMIEMDCYMDSLSGSSWS
jgi:hypothetical protein